MKRQVIIAMPILFCIVILIYLWVKFETLAIEEAAQIGPKPAVMPFACAKATPAGFVRLARALGHSRKSRGCCRCERALR